MEFFDALMGIGRTNRACPGAPRDEAEALAVMDRFGVSEALVYHTASRDYDPTVGNPVVAAMKSNRLHPIFGFESALPAEPKPAEFLDQALAAGAKAILVNSALRGVRIERNRRLGELADLMAERRIPLLATHRWPIGIEDLADWYGLADFCNAHPNLPVLAWQIRSRGNRPMFDALAEAPNLRVVLSSIWQAQSLECIHDTFGAERVVFSQGLPEILPGTFHTVVTCAGIPPASREAVAAGNIRALLKEARYD